MKLQKTIKKTTEREIDVELPYYAKSVGGTHYYCVYGTGDWDCLVIAPSAGNHLQIENTCTNNGFHKNSVQISSEEFAIAYGQAKTEIEKLMEKIYIPETI